MTIMQKLRSNSRKVTWFILVPVVIAFTLFGLGVSLDALMGNEQGKEKYVIDGVKVTEELHSRTDRLWSAIRSLGGTSGNVSEDEVRQIIGECILARKMGFDVTDAEIDVSMAKEFGSSQSAYEATLNRAGMSGSDIRFWFEQKILREKYSNFQRNGIVPTASDVYKKFDYDRCNYEIKFTIAKPEDFKEDVIIDDDRLKTYYDEAAEKWNTLIDKRLLKKRLENSLDDVKDELKTVSDEIMKLEEEDYIKKCDIVDGPFATVHFIMVPYEDVKKDITVDRMAEEVSTHYYETLEKYRRLDLVPPPKYGPEPPADTLPPTEGTGVDLNPIMPDNPEVPPTPDVDNDEVPNTEENKEASVEKKHMLYSEYGSEFKNLDEVRDEVVKDLIDVKSRDKADEILTEIRNLIAQMDLEKYDFNIIDKQLNKKLGEKFPFKIEEKVITPQNAETIETYGSSELKLKAFGSSEHQFDYWTHYTEDHLDTLSEVLLVPTGKYIFFVRQEERAVIKKFEDVKTVLEVAYRAQEEKRLAKEMAESIIKSLESGKSIADLGPNLVWQDAMGTKVSLMYLREFGDTGFTEGMICTRPIWIEDQREAFWRVQVLVKIRKPDIAGFGTDFETFQAGAKTEATGERPDQPKGVLGKLQRYDKKLFGIKLEEEAEPKP